MADFSLADVMALQDKDDGGMFGGGYAWIILIFLFFLAFGGNGFGFGGNRNEEFDTQRDILTTASNTQRDILMSSCNTQKEVQNVNYQTLLGFKDQSMQMAQCCLAKMKNFVMKIKEFFVGNHSSNVMQVA